MDAYRASSNSWYCHDETDKHRSHSSILVRRRQRIAMGKQQCQSKAQLNYFPFDEARFRSFMAEKSSSPPASLVSSLIRYTLSLIAAWTSFIFRLDCRETRTMIYRLSSQSTSHFPYALRSLRFECPLTIRANKREVRFTFQFGLADVRFFQLARPFFTGLADKFPTLLAPSDWSVSQTKWNIGNWKSSASTFDRLNRRFWMFKNVVINIVSQSLSCDTKSIIIIECYQSQSNKPKPNYDLRVWSSRQSSNQCLTEVI